MIYSWFTAPKIAESVLNWIESEPGTIPSPSGSLLISGRQSVDSSMSSVGSSDCPYTFVCEDNPRRTSTPEETSLKSFRKPRSKSKAVFSDVMLRRIALETDCSSMYFNRLPHSKKIKLLKHTRTMISVSTEFAKSLANILKLNLIELKNWLWLRQEKNVKMAQNQDIPPEVIPLLNEEFKWSSCLMEDRSLLLSYMLDLSPDTVRSWFKIRQKWKRAKLHSGNDSLDGGTAGENSVSCPGSGAVPENSALSKSDSPAEKLIYSSSLSARIEGLKKISFFYNLSPSNQLMLLKRFHDLPLHGQIPIMDITAELVAALTVSSDRDTTQPVPDFGDLFIWLEETRLSYQKLAKAEHPASMVRDEAAAFLEDEFSMSNMISDGRVLMLSYVLQLTVNQVRQWFDLRNIKLQEQAVVSLSPANLSSTRVATSCTEAQFIQLMEMFKADGSISPENIENVAGLTELPPSQVRYWFNATQQTLGSFTRNQVLENLAANLSEYIFMELEVRYRHSRRISFQQASASASILGMEDARSVLSWFEWRRTYHLLKAPSPGEDIPEQYEKIFSILEGNCVNPLGVLVDPSNYGICYDDSNRAIFPLWSGPAVNSSHDEASAEVTSNLTIASVSCVPTMDTIIDSVVNQTSSAP